MGTFWRHFGDTLERLVETIISLMFPVYVFQLYMSLPIVKNFKNEAKERKIIKSIFVIQKIEKIYFTKSNKN